uniref:Uncharacterized protein n=1 Tax=Globisporangium ultimum (strain ATCC 200006 / CBS 805.95 / DAOM BR144) TaxID=431595 RepID=K3WJR3_GLOUD
MAARNSSSSSRSWQPVVTATAVTLAALPVGYYLWKRSMQRAERQEALKLLRKVELIVAEVSVRLMHLENQAEDAVANEDQEEPESPEEQEANSTLNSYYHFDSKGNKLKTKWDSYDVDAELERLEQEEQQDNASASSASVAKKTSAKPARKYAPIDKIKLITTAGGIEHEFEAVLEFLDDIRGDDQVKQLRKSIVQKITKEHFSRIDRIRTILA